MFRELARIKQKLTEEECAEILKNETRGVLSVMGDEAYPYGMPMNHYYNEEDGAVYFHTGRHGHRTDSIKNNNKVSFCVFDKGFADEGKWALNVKSVIVFGRIEIIDDITRVIDISKKLSYKFTRDEVYIDKEIEKYANNTILLRLVPEHICGKRVTEA